jgi:hypothetical protein
VAKLVMEVMNLVRVISNLPIVIRQFNSEIINLQRKNAYLYVAVGRQSSHATNFFVLQPKRLWKMPGRPLGTQ